MLNSPIQFSDSQKKLLYIVYGLYLASIFVSGLTALIGVILLYIKRNELPDYSDHCHYLIRTFWGVLLCYAIGFLSMLFMIGGIIILAGIVWFFVRTISGGLKLHDNKGVDPLSWWI